MYTEDIIDNRERTQWQDVLSRVFMTFFLYCFIGYLNETFLEVVFYSKPFSNRGFLWGPYLPIYGAGALIILAAFNKWRQKITISRIFLCFVGSIVLTTLLELAGSYIMELIVGRFTWTYKNLPYNFEGRIALAPSLLFGVGGILLLYVVQPLYDKLLKRFSEVFRVLSLLLLMVMFIDLVMVVVFKTRVH